MAAEHIQTMGAELRDTAALSTRPLRARAVMTAMGRWIARTTCAMQGHDKLTHRERDRLTLRCAVCGHETDGWDVSGPRPVPRYAGDPQRHAMARKVQAR